jgi:hypothetical protein
MNDIRGGRVTSYMDDIRYSAVAEEEVRSLDQVNLVNALKARAGRSRHLIESKRVGRIAVHR